MQRQFPSDGPLLPHDPPPTGLFHREREREIILHALQSQRRAAVWAPRYSGRTTFLYYLEEHLRRQGELAVYVSPEDHLDVSSRGSLFQSLGQHIAARLSLALSDVGTVNDWDLPDALLSFFDHVLDTLRPQVRLTVLLDDADKLFSAALATLLRCIRGLNNLKRQAGSRLAFVVAGAVSFRNLKLLDPSEVSPFEHWKFCHLDDLGTADAATYLGNAFRAIGVAVTEEALALAVRHVGGDLRMLNLLGQQVADYHSSSGERVSAEAVGTIVQDMLANYANERSIAYMLSVIAHDPRCLRVVDRVLVEPEGDSTKFATDDLYASQRERFEISNQELSGGLILLEKDGHPARWMVRNRLRGDILRRHFSTRRLVRAFLDLGQYERAEALIKNRLASELEKEFRDEILFFDESAVRDVVEWFWSHGAREKEPLDAGALQERGSGRGSKKPAAVDRVVAGFDALAFVLERILGIENAVLYEVEAGSGQLVMNGFFPRARTVESRDSIHLGRSSHESRPQEARAYVAKVYTVEIEEHKSLKVAIPLKNAENEVTGILSFRTERYTKEDWATLFVRIPIVERAVNSIWRLLSRYERDQYKGLRGAQPWISVEFDTEVYGYFARNKARFPADLPARFLEFRSGIIFNEVVRALESRRSLLIAELSHLNANVLFELGLALGLNRPGLPIREKDRELNLVPLEGLLRETYQLGKILGEAFFDQLRERWTSYQINADRADFIHLLNEEVAPPSADGGLLLVVDHNRFRDSGAYRRAVETAARRAGLKRIVYLWQGGARDTRLGREVRAEGTTPLLSIYKLVQKATAVVARIERIEDEDHHVVRFLPTGIAVGLARRRRMENVVLTSRVRSREGRPVSLPGDFNGCEPIEFSSAARKVFVDDLSLDLLRIVEMGAANHE